MTVFSFTNSDVKAIIDAFDNYYLNGVPVLFPNEQAERDARDSLRASFATSGNTVDLTEYRRAVVADACYGRLNFFERNNLTNLETATRDRLVTVIQKLEGAAPINTKNR